MEGTESVGNQTTASAPVLPRTEAAAAPPDESWRSEVGETGDGRLWCLAALETDSAWWFTVYYPADAAYTGAAAVYRCDRSSGAYTLIDVVPDGTVDGFCEADGFVWYSACDAAAIRFMRVAEAGGAPRPGLELLADRCDWLDECNPLKFFVTHGLLFVYDSGTSAAIYRLSDGECLTKGAGRYSLDISDGAFWGDYLYYTTHAARDFALYRLNLNTLESELLRGDTRDGKAITESDPPKTFRCDNLEAYEGELYLSVRCPGGVLRYAEGGADEVLLTLPDEIWGPELKVTGGRLVGELDGVEYVYDAAGGAFIAAGAASCAQRTD